MERITTEKGLIPIFITLTLPSKFHPFKKNKKKDTIYKLNPNFDYIEIEESINKGYKLLNKIYKEFYKNVKSNKKNKDMKFIKIIEPHKTLIPHLHRILYINPNTFNSVKKTFLKIVYKYKLKKTQIEEVTTSKGSSYIIKYLLKNFKSDELKKFDGWKKNHKIRIFTMSNLTLSNDIFKKLYYNNKNLNIKVLENIKRNKIKYKNLYEFYTKNTTIKKIYIDENYKLIKTKIINNKKKNLFEFSQIIKIEKSIKFTKKEIKQNKETLLKTIDYLKNMYYKNKYKKYKTFFKVIKKGMFLYMTDEPIYEIDVYRENINSKKIKTYKSIKFKLYNKKKKKEIINNETFKKELIKQ